MAEVDPDTLLEWLQTGTGDERDMQLIALEQLCMLLLMSDNVDRCFERWDCFLCSCMSSAISVLNIFLFYPITVVFKYANRPASYL